jgi:hypothetical protein
MRFVPDSDRKAVAAALRPIYTAPTAEIAAIELDTFADSNLGKKYRATVATWRNAWERFIPFLAFPPEVRRIIYTTNAIESLHSQMRKNIASRKVFPHDDSVIKILFLNIRNFTNRWTRRQGSDIVMSQLLVPVRRSPQVPLGRFSLNSLAPPLTQLLLQPHINGRPRGYYIIDFGTDMTLQDASFYECPSSTSRSTLGKSDL